MKWKEKDDLSWCCINRRRSYDDGDSKDANNQTTNAVLMERSTKEAPLPVEKVKKTEKKKKRKGRKHKKYLCFVSFFTLILLLFFLFALFDYDDASSSYIALSPKGLELLLIIISQSIIFRIISFISSIFSYISL
jgi:uncharacterized integral membrane protein